MRLPKYRRFVSQHPWFPRVARSLLDWQYIGQGKISPDRAIELVFGKDVSHLGVMPYTECNLQRQTGQDTQYLGRKLLTSPIKATIIQTFRIVFHNEGEERFTQDHNMSMGTIQESIDAYRTKHVDAIVELTFLGIGSGVHTHRLNVFVFPES